MDITKIAQAALSGDLRAEGHLFQALHVRFVAVAKLYLRHEDAQDAAQQACLTIAQKYREIPSVEGFAAWAHQILRNKIGNILKRQRVESGVIAGHTDTEARSNWGSADADLIRRSLIQALDRVGRHDRRYVRVLNLVHLGYSADEIAERLGVTRSHLYVLLHRGRMLLAKELGDHHE